MFGPRCTVVVPNCDVIRKCRRMGSVPAGILFLLFCAFAATIVDGQVVQKTRFSCAGRPTGYYADVETGCQVYHMCDGLGRQFSYSCPNATLFQQRMMVCDHWYMVNCSKAEADFSANLLIGQKGIPFIDDGDESRSFQRTPRPDLLSHSSAPDFNFNSRTGKAYSHENRLNLVGVDTEGEQNNVNEKPSYVLPSHWSIQHEDQNQASTRYASIPSFTRSPTRTYPTTTSTTPQPPVVNFNSNFKATTPVYPQSVDPKVLVPRGDELGLQPPHSNEVDVPEVNFQSNFQATTPNYPTSVDPNVALSSGDQTGLIPPKNADTETSTEASAVSVNFPSKFQATTPDYPKVVDESANFPAGEEIGVVPPVADNEAPPKSQDQNVETTASPSDSSVNFPSKFQATTPDYPKVVDESVNFPEGEEIGILPPVHDYESDLLPPVAPVDDGKHESPSKYYEPPKVPTIENSEESWKKLRAQFLIPEYEFPLETDSRPGYEGGSDSFHPNGST